MSEHPAVERSETEDSGSGGRWIPLESNPDVRLFSRSTKSMLSLAIGSIDRDCSTKHRIDKPFKPQ